MAESLDIKIRALLDDSQLTALDTNLKEPRTIKVNVDLNQDSLKSLDNRITKALDTGLSSKTALSSQKASKALTNAIQDSAKSSLLKDISSFQKTYANADKNVSKALNALYSNVSNTGEQDLNKINQFSKQFDNIQKQVKTLSDINKQIESYRKTAADYSGVKGGEDVVNSANQAAAALENCKNKLNQIQDVRTTDISSKLKSEMQIVKQATDSATQALERFNNATKRDNFGARPSKSQNDFSSWLNKNNNVYSNADLANKANQIQQWQRDLDNLYKNNENANLSVLKTQQKQIDKEIQSFKSAARAQNLMGASKYNANSLLSDIENFRKASGSLDAKASQALNAIYRGIQNTDPTDIDRLSRYTKQFENVKAQVESLNNINKQIASYNQTAKTYGKLEADKSSDVANAYKQAVSALENYRIKLTQMQGARNINIGSVMQREMNEVKKATDSATQALENFNSQVSRNAAAMKAGNAKNSFESWVNEHDKVNKDTGLKAWAETILGRYGAVEQLYTTSDVDRKVIAEEEKLLNQEVKKFKSSAKSKGLDGKTFLSRFRSGLGQ